MIDRYRRRDLTVGKRHKDIGLVVHARLMNRRERHGARCMLAQERREAEQLLALERALERVLHQLFAEFNC